MDWGLGAGGSQGNEGDREFSYINITGWGSWCILIYWMRESGCIARASHFTVVSWLLQFDLYFVFARFHQHWHPLMHWRDTHKSLVIPFTRLTSQAFFLSISILQRYTLIIFCSLTYCHAFVSPCVNNVCMCHVSAHTHAWQQTSCAWGEDCARPCGWKGEILCDLIQQLADMRKEFSLFGLVL